jgi:hypothetical protein
MKLTEFGLYIAPGMKNSLYVPKCIQCVFVKLIHLKGIFYFCYVPYFLQIINYGNNMYDSCIYQFGRKACKLVNSTNFGFWIFGRFFSE